MNNKAVKETILWARREELPEDQVFARALQVFITSEVHPTLSAPMKQLTDAYIADEKRVFAKSGVDLSPLDGKGRSDAFINRLNEIKHDAFRSIGMAVRCAAEAAINAATRMGGTPKDGDEALDGSITTAVFSILANDMRWDITLAYKDECELQGVDLYPYERGNEGPRDIYEDEDLREAYDAVVEVAASMISNAISAVREEMAAEDQPLTAKPKKHSKKVH